MRRRKEGTLAKLSYDPAIDPGPSAGFSGLAHFLLKSADLAARVKSEYGENTLMGERADQLLVQLRRIKQEIELGVTRHTVYRGIVAAIARENILQEYTSDGGRRGLQVKTYLEAREKQVQLTGKINRTQLARDCGMAPKNLRKWEKSNIE